MDLPSERGRLRASVHPGREQTETEETGWLRWPCGWSSLSIR